MRYWHTYHCSPYIVWIVTLTKNLYKGKGQVKGYL